MTKSWYAKQDTYQDIVIDEDRIKKVRIVPVTKISEVLKEALDWKDPLDKK